MPTRLTYLGWSSFIFTTPDTSRIIIDPYLAGHAEYGIPPSPVRRTELGDIAAVVVTHASFDHLGEALDIMRESPTAVLCAGLDVRMHALRAGLPESRLYTLVSGGRYRFGSWSIKAVQAHHVSLTQLDNGSYLTGQPLSYFLNFGDVTVFAGGDTSIHSDMRLFGRLYRPHVAILGIDGILVNGQPAVEMEPAEAALAVSMLKARLAIPMHFRPGSSLVNAFVNELAKLRPKVESLVLDAGQSIQLNAGGLPILVD